METKKSWSKGIGAADRKRKKQVFVFYSICGASVLSFLLVCQQISHSLTIIAKKEDVNITLTGNIPWEVLPSRIKPANGTRKIFVDLGANCGNTYLKHRQQFAADGDEWESYLWEPSPQMHTFFLDGISKKYPSVHVIPYAAGLRNEELRLYIHEGQEGVTDIEQFRDGGKCDPNSPYNPSGGSTVFRQAKVAGEPVTIKSIDFPKWLSLLNIQQNDTFILKIDIEGAELEILDKMLTNESDNNLCYTDLIKMEYHKSIFKEGTYMYMKHESFEEAFSVGLKEKCGRDVKFQRLSR